MGNTTSSDNHHAHASASSQRRRSRSSSLNFHYTLPHPEKKTAAPTVVTATTSSTPHKNAGARQPFQFSVTEPIDAEAPSPSSVHASPDPSAYGQSVDSTASGRHGMMPPSDLNSISAPPSTSWASPPPIANSAPTPASSQADAMAPSAPTVTRAVPMATGRSGWVSGTGSSSPWVGSLSSSASSQHRASISGPYYRTRGMSINRDDIDDDMAQSQLSQPQSSYSSRRRSILQPENKGVPTIITWTQGGQNVYVTGTFNGWKHKIKLVKSTQDFSAVLDLPPGTHRLKFIVDDEWKCSNDMETATDPEGNLVNYLQVEDEEVDGDLCNATEEGSGSGASTPTEEYTSRIPDELLAFASTMSSADSVNAAQRAAMEWDRRHAQPPALPPHLEKVLLNSQALSEEDNSVLPEPNHVTLNHLYACSIKDNVMALSTTTRYRKKYVTTMYYRPIIGKD